MDRLKSLWRKFSRPLGLGKPRRPYWVEPANAVTRAIDEGRPLFTMATLDQPVASPSSAFVPAPPAPIAEEHDDAPGEPTAPKRPGVAA